MKEKITKSQNSNESVLEKIKKLRSRRLKEYNNTLLNEIERECRKVRMEYYKKENKLELTEYEFNTLINSTLEEALEFLYFHKNGMLLIDHNGYEIKEAIRRTLRRSPDYIKELTIDTLRRGGLVHNIGQYVDGLGVVTVKYLYLLINVIIGTDDIVIEI